MPNNEEIIVRFERVTEAIMAEEALTGQGVMARVMPTPSSIHAGCGFCLRFAPEDMERAAAFLAERGMVVTEAYTREEAGGPPVYRRINVVR